SLWAGMAGMRSNRHLRLNAVRVQSLVKGADCIPHGGNGRVRGYLPSSRKFHLSRATREPKKGLERLTIHRSVPFFRISALRVGNLGHAGYPPLPDLTILRMVHRALKLETQLLEDAGGGISLGQRLRPDRRDAVLDGELDEASGHPGCDAAAFMRRKGEIGDFHCTGYGRALECTGADDPAVLLGKVSRPWQLRRSLRINGNDRGAQILQERGVLYLRAGREFA